MARIMKDSGIEWIGEIPSNWENTKLKNIANIIRGGSPRPIDAYLTDSLDGYNWIKIGDTRKGYKYIDSTRQKIIVEGVSKSRVVHKGDLLLTNSMSFGEPYILNIDGCIHDGWVSFTECIGVDIDFLYYILSSPLCLIQFKQQVDGGVVQNLNINKIGSTSVFLPPPSEQKAIADFLDRQCAEIDAVIAKTKATIEEYKRLKQAVITEAVTKGIRGDRPMRDSGIEWISKIASEWKISRVGLHYDIILGKMLCDKQLQDDYTLEVYFCAANVHFEGIDTQGLKKMWFSPSEKQSYAVSIGDLLVVEGGAGAGGANVVVQLECPTYIQNSIMIVRGKNESSNRFLRYWIECLVKKGYISVVCNKATIPHFTKDKLATMPIPVLSESEMFEITEYLDKKCAEIDALIARKTALLDELEAYKKSVIYEYVTGKREVI